MSLGGKVFLKQKLNIQLIQALEDGNTVIKFKKKLNPLRAQIVPISKNRNSKDFELAQHLKHLLVNNENGAFGYIEIAGKINFYEENVERPSETAEELSEGFDISLRGSFPWFLNTLQNEGSRASFEVQFENVVSVTGQTCVVIFSQLNDCPFAKDLSNEHWNLSYKNEYVEFGRNSATWDLLFRPKAKGSKSPMLSVVVCADISERMAQSLLIMNPYGSKYILSPYQNEIKNERQQEIFAATQPDTLIVGQSGKEWRVQSKYLIDSSAVFKAMLEKPNFVEGRTKRVNLDDLEDKVIDCLLHYLSYFSMEECLNDVGMAITMLEVADRFQINEFTKALEEMLMRRSNIGHKDATKLFSFVRRLDHFHLLKRKTLVSLQKTRKEWTNLAEYKQQFIDDPELAWDLMNSLFENGFFDNGAFFQLYKCTYCN